MAFASGGSAFLSGSAVSQLSASRSPAGSASPRRGSLVCRCVGTAGPSGRTAAHTLPSGKFIVQQQHLQGHLQKSFGPRLGSTARVSLLRTAVYSQDTVAAEAEMGVQRLLAESRSLADRMRRAASIAVFAGWRLTSLAIRVASNIARAVVGDIGRHLRHREQLTLQRQREEAQEKLREQAVQLRESRRRDHALRQRSSGDKAFTQMLFAQDNPERDLDDKWADLRKHFSGTNEFSAKVQQLYTAAQRSSRAVQQQLGDTEADSAHMWAVLGSHSVVQEEEALRSLLFTQMLQSNS